MDCSDEMVSVVRVERVKAVAVLGCVKPKRKQADEEEDLLEDALQEAAGRGRSSKRKLGDKKLRRRIRKKMKANDKHAMIAAAAVTAGAPAPAPADNESSSSESDSSTSDSTSSSSSQSSGVFVHGPTVLPPPLAPPSPMHPLAGPLVVPSKLRSLSDLGIKAVEMPRPHGRRAVCKICHNAILGKDIRCEYVYDRRAQWPGYVHLKCTLKLEDVFLPAARDICLAADTSGASLTHRFFQSPCTVQWKAQAFHRLTTPYSREAWMI